MKATHTQMRGVNAKRLHATVNAGVAVVDGFCKVERRGSLYVMRRFDRAENFRFVHSLAVDSTDGDRLLAHWEGFVANQRAMAASEERAA